MNKKAIAIGVIKHPIIKKLLESKIATTSTINKLIADEIIKESDGGIDSLLKNIAVTYPSTVIKAASTLGNSPDGTEVGDVENNTLEFSNEYEKLMDSIITGIVDPIIENSSMVAMAAGNPGYLENINRVFGLFEADELEQYKKDGIGQQLALLLDKIKNLAGDYSVTGETGAASGDNINEIVEIAKKIKALYTQYRDSQAKPEVVAQEMSDAIKDEGGKEGQEGETSASDNLRSVADPENKEVHKKVADESASPQDAENAIRTTGNQAKNEPNANEDEIEAQVNQAIKNVNDQFPDEPGDTTEAGTIGRLDAVEKYEAKIEDIGQSPAQAMMEFVENFLKVRTLNNK